MSVKSDFYTAISICPSSRSGALWEGFVLGSPEQIFYGLTFEECLGKIVLSNSDNMAIHIVRNYKEEKNRSEELWKILQSVFDEKQSKVDVLD